MKKFSLLLLGTLALAGCQDSEVSVAQTPHPLDGAPPPAATAAAQPELPAGHPPIASAQQGAAAPMSGQMPSGRNMRAQGLPSGSVSQAGTPEWQVPDTWTAGPQSSVRKGSFAAGEIDISVTAFPGDVGGMLQNVNRWRQQIGLAPVAPQDLESLVQPMAVDGKGGFLISLKGDAQSTLAVSVMHQGTSWFFKMTGPSEAVEAEANNFIAFVESVKFP